MSISLFEILNVYFIMPMPGSQEIKSLDIAYFLYCHRWIFSVCFALMIAIGAINAFKVKHKWMPAAGFIIAIIVAYFFNFQIKSLPYSIPDLSSSGAGYNRMETLYGYLLQCLQDRQGL